MWQMRSWGEKPRAKMNGKGNENVIKKKCCTKGEFVVYKNWKYPT